MCWSVGLSNVEYTTSAASTVRCQSVTSSGRSSTSRTITCVSGLELMIPFAICLRTVVFPAFGGDTTMPRCPLPIGAIMSMMRSVTAVGPDSPEPLVGEQRRELVEVAPFLRRLRVHVVDLLDLEERPVLLVVARLAHLAGHDVPWELVLAHLGHRDVDVVGARQVSRRTHEAVPVGEQVEDPGSGGAVFSASMRSCSSRSRRSSRICRRSSRVGRRRRGCADRPIAGLPLGRHDRRRRP